MEVPIKLDFESDLLLVEDDTDCKENSQDDQMLQIYV